ncbi:hypothetical protein B0J17DRAFT_711458 [Rhizoctonia solani]|nr:hypothetical protein B0J17DRAFT_711458 [Rhizoctonia solani]
MSNQPAHTSDATGAGGPVEPAAQGSGPAQPAASLASQTDDPNAATDPEPQVQQGTIILIPALALNLSTAFLDRKTTIMPTAPAAPRVVFCTCSPVESYHIGLDYCGSYNPNYDIQFVTPELPGRLPESFRYPKYTGNIQWLVISLIQTEITTVPKQGDPSDWERRVAAFYIKVLKPISTRRSKCQKMAVKRRLKTPDELAL